MASLQAPAAIPLSSARSVPNREPARQAIEIELVAAVIAVANDEPMVRVVYDTTVEPRRAKLPSAMFQPMQSTSLDVSLRQGVHAETGLDLGYVEQLQAVAMPDDTNGGRPRTTTKLSIAYLALAHLPDIGTERTPSWLSWYGFFPWEDWRRGKPALLGKVIEPQLRAWADQAGQDNDASTELGRRERIRIAFGLDGAGWDEEKVSERYDLLQAAGLLDDSEEPSLGMALYGDHRRCLAVAVSRLRSKIKSRPVVFELMPDLFTLYELQRTVEAILGPHLHKQNFRRLVEHMGLVEPTDEIKSHTGGRPAKLFRFRQSVLWERLQPGVRVRGARN